MPKRVLANRICPATARTIIGLILLCGFSCGDSTEGSDDPIVGADSAVATIDAARYDAAETLDPADAHPPAADANSRADARVDPPADAGGGAANDAAPGGGGLEQTINCGAETCSRDVEICCFTGFPNITQSCSTVAACTNLVATCDGPEDCAAGEICCGDTSGASCRLPSDCQGFTAGQLCHEDSDCESNDCHEIQFSAWPVC